MALLTLMRLRKRQRLSGTEKGTEALQTRQRLSDCRRGSASGAAKGVAPSVALQKEGNAEMLQKNVPVTALRNNTLGSRRSRAKRKGNLKKIGGRKILAEK